MRDTEDAGPAFKTRVERKTDLADTVAAAGDLCEERNATELRAT